MEPLISFLSSTTKSFVFWDFFGVNLFASTLSALLVSYHSFTRFPSSINVLTSFIISSLLLVILKCLFFLNPLTALLKYSSQTIQFTHLKYKSTVLNIHIEVYNYHYNLILQYFLTQNEPCIHPSTSGHSPFPFISNPKKPLIYFLYVQICLFWTFYINGLS